MAFPGWEVRALIVCKFRVDFRLCVEQAHVVFLVSYRRVLSLSHSSMGFQTLYARYFGCAVCRSGSLEFWHSWRVLCYFSSLPPGRSTDLYTSNKRLNLNPRRITRSGKCGLLSLVCKDSCPSFLRASLFSWIFDL